MKSKNIRWPQGGREVTVRRPHGCCRTAAVRASWGRRKAAVRPPDDFLGTQDRVKTVCHLTTIARRPYGHRTATSRCGCVVAALRFLKKSLVTSKTVRSPYGLHKNLKAAVRFGRLWSPHGRRKHATSYMWPWRYTVCSIRVHCTRNAFTKGGINVFVTQRKYALRQVEL